MGSVLLRLYINFNSIKINILLILIRQDTYSNLYKVVF